MTVLRRREGKKGRERRGGVRGIDTMSPAQFGWEEASPEVPSSRGGENRRIEAKLTYCVLFRSREYKGFEIPCRVCREKKKKERFLHPFLHSRIEEVQKKVYLCSSFSWRRGKKRKKRGRGGEGMNSLAAAPLPGASDFFAEANRKKRGNKSRPFVGKKKTKEKREEKKKHVLDLGGISYDAKLKKGGE